MNPVPDKDSLARVFCVRLRFLRFGVLVAGLGAVGCHLWFFLCHVPQKQRLPVPSLYVPAILSMRRVKECSDLLYNLFFFLSAARKSQEIIHLLTVVSDKQAFPPFFSFFSLCLPRRHKAFRSSPAVVRWRHRNVSLMCPPPAPPHPTLQLQSEVEKPLLSFRDNFKKDMKRFDHHIADLRKQLIGRYATVEKVRDRRRKFGVMASTTTHTQTF